MKLKNLIDQNRNSFDSYEPEDGHLERFQDKLYKSKTQNSSLKVYLMAASIVAVSLLATIMLYMIMAQMPQLQNGGIALHEISEEYKEVEVYYNRYIEERMEVLNHIQCKSPVIQKAMILKEIQEFDLIYLNLQHDLLDSGENERVINAMIETYQKKAEMLDRVIKIIKQNC